MPRWLILIAMLTCALFLGCPSDGDDDDVTDDDDDVTDDDDTTDDDDDDDTVADPAMDLDATGFHAGQWAWVHVTVDDFEIDDETTWCCYDEAALVISGTENVTPTELDVFLMFGALTDGTQTIGLENADGVQVTADLTVASVDITDVDAGEPAASGVCGGALEYDLFHFTGSDGGQFVNFLPTNLGTDFTPYVWVTEADGLTYLAQNWYAPDDDLVDSAATWFFEQDETYLRIAAQDGANDTDQTFDLDVIVTEPLAELAEAEVEDNGDPAAPQDLGNLIPGTVVTITGEFDAVGHDGNNVWNEDLDWFAFEVLADTNLSVQLDWVDPADDYDLMIYDASANTPDEAVFDDLVGWFYAASLNHPERTSTVLRPGIPYVLFVAGWEGDPGAYEVTMALSPEL
jgi:hypothetical protein